MWQSHFHLLSASRRSRNLCQNQIFFPLLIVGFRDARKISAWDIWPKNHAPASLRVKLKRCNTHGKKWMKLLTGFLCSLPGLLSKLYPQERGSHPSCEEPLGHTRHCWHAERFLPQEHRWIFHADSPNDKCLKKNINPIPNFSTSAAGQGGLGCGKSFLAAACRDAHRCRRG